jgi:hypothetical protein
MIPGSLQNHVLGTNEKPKSVLDSALHVIIKHEIFSDFFTLVQSNGHTEELEPDEAREWFKIRGAKMDAVEKALDHAWNFKRAEFYIQTPKEPSIAGRPAWAPKL